MKAITNHTVFHVTNVERSIDFFTNQLGFAVDFKFGEPFSYARLSLGDAYLHISSGYPYKNNTSHGNMYTVFDEIDELYNALVKADVDFYCPIGNREYGIRDFAIKDPDENKIGFGTEIQTSAANC